MGNANIRHGSKTFAKFSGCFPKFSDSAQLSWLPNPIRIIGQCNTLEGNTGAATCFCALDLGEA